MPEKNKYFTGRTGEITVLDNNFRNSSISVITSTQSIVGVGGVGKTQLATAFFYNAIETQKINKDVSYNLVAWLSATTNNISEQYRELGQFLGINLYNVDAAKVPTIVQKQVKKLPRVLLIFDNAENYEAIQNYLPVSTSEENWCCHCLLTSRQQCWYRTSRHGFINTLALDVLPLEEATTYMSRVLCDAGVLANQSAQKALLQELAQLLGCFPLALSQAAAYLVRQFDSKGSVSIENYIKNYKKSKAARAHLLQQRLMQGDPYITEKGSGHLATVFMTWSASKQVIDARSSRATEIMTVCAFLAPDNIQEKLLRAWLKKSPDSNPLPTKLALEEIKGILQDYSMVYRSTLQGVLRIHRLMQAIHRISLNEDEKRLYIEKLLGIIEEKFIYDKNIPVPDMTHEMFPHAIELIQHALTNRIKINFSLLFSLIEYLIFEVGEYKKSEEYIEIILAEDPCNRRALFNLTYNQLVYKEIKKTEEYADRGLADDVVDDEYKAALLWAKAGNLQARSNSQEALSYLEQATVIFNRLLPIDKRDWYARHCNHVKALILLDDEQFEEAEAAFRRNLDLLDSTDNLLLAAIYQMCGHALFNQGKYEEAYKNYRESQKIRQEFPEEEIALAESWHAFGMVEYTRHNYADAINLFKRSIEVKKQYGNVSYANGLYAMGLALYMDNRKEDGRAAFEKAVKVYKASYQEEIAYDPYAFEEVFNIETADMSESAISTLGKKHPYRIRKQVQKRIAAEKRRDNKLSQVKFCMKK